MCCANPISVVATNTRRPGRTTTHPILDEVAELFAGLEEGNNVTVAVKLEKDSEEAEVDEGSSRPSLVDAIARKITQFRDPAASYRVVRTDNPLEWRVWIKKVASTTEPDSGDEEE